MRKYVTKIPGSNHYIYKIGFGTYDILKSGLNNSEIKELINDFICMGGNVIDTSIYDLGARKGDVVEAQKIVGEWVVDYGKRELACLVGKSNFLLSESTLKDDVEETLKNLNTNYIDLFLVNGDDEKTDVEIVINEFEELKKQGKILSYGCSNWKPYRIRQAMEYSKKNNFEGFTVNQMLWNIGSKYMNPIKGNDFYIKMNDEMMDIHKEFEILAMPYNSLANGIFAKIYTYENEPETIDIENVKENSPYYTKANLKVYERMKELSEKYIATPGWVALGYLFNQEIETCAIFSCKNLGQLKEAFEAVDRGYGVEDFKNILDFEREAALV